MKIYVINLARNVERKKHIEQQLKALGLSVEWSEACDGYAIPKHKLEDAKEARPLENWQSPGHIGCLFSHVKLWKRIAKGTDACACIMEDDVHISKAFAQFLKYEECFPKNFDLIRCEYSPGRLLLSRKRFLSDIETGVSLHKLLSPSWGAAAYIISKACAEKMVAIPARQQRVADYLLFDFDESPVARDFSIYQLSPAAVVQDKNIANQDLKHHFKSDLDPDYVPTQTFNETWRALKKGNLGYVIRTLQGYRPLKYQI